MKQFRYDTSGEWIKGNVHIHSTLSDGGKTPAELAEMYAAQGYGFLFRTDHWAPSDVAAETGDAPLLWLDGVELDGQDGTGAMYHVNCLGRVEGLDRQMGLEAAMAEAKRQGAMLILAHPYWTGNTPDDLMRHPFDGVEIYNHVCRWLNGKGDSLYLWDWALERRPDQLGLAVDDAHLRPEHPGWNGGWIVVNVRERTRETILAAIRAGHFYSSCGPEFQAVEWDGAAVTVRTSGVAQIRVVWPRWGGDRIGGFDGTTLTEATFQIPPDGPAVRIEIEDAQGRRAWTNTLFTEAGASPGRVSPA